MTRYLIKNATLVNEGQVFASDVLIENERISKIASNISAPADADIIDAEGNWLLPGMIDDQVHFREPGLTHKGNIQTESRAAIAGGITSFMEMPNVSPSTTTVEALKQKCEIAQRNAAGNYAFYLGATPDNLDEIKAVDPTWVCGVKVFMGASTGDLLVDHPVALENIFRECPTLIATHCENGNVIKSNTEALGLAPEALRIEHHPVLRDTNACYESSSYAVGLAKKYGSNLHVLHITTQKELELFASGPIEGKRITAEACVHHLWFSQADYAEKGNLIKCNPAIKAQSDRLALLQGLKDGTIDIIATDHAPHTWQEKQQDFYKAPAGLPLVQHALLTLLDQVEQGTMTLSQVVQKTAHNPAIRYQIEDRGYLREGYFADLVLVNPNKSTSACHDNSLSLCGWTPFDGHTFKNQIATTFVNGNKVYDGTTVSPESFGQALIFNR